MSYDELWGSTSESSRRLWDELTPVPTRRNSIRFITTYAGWEGESTLLWDLFKQVVGRDEHPDGQGVRLHATRQGTAHGRVLPYPTAPVGVGTGPGLRDLRTRPCPAIGIAPACQPSLSLFRPSRTA